MNLILRLAGRVLDQSKVDHHLLSSTPQVYRQSIVSRSREERQRILPFYLPDQQSHTTNNVQTEGIFTNPKSQFSKSILKSIFHAVVVEVDRKDFVLNISIVVINITIFVYLNCFTLNFLPIGNIQYTMDYEIDGYVTSIRI